MFAGMSARYVEHERLIARVCGGHASIDSLGSQEEPIEEGVRLLCEALLGIRAGERSTALQKLHAAEKLDPGSPILATLIVAPEPTGEATTSRLEALLKEWPDLAYPRLYLAGFRLGSGDADSA